MTQYGNRPEDSLFVDAVDTPLTEELATFSLKKAYKEVFNEEPSLNTLAILFAHTKLETGFKYCKNWNWGNIKRLKGQKYTSYKCSEILNGKNEIFYPYHIQTFFAAWDTAIEGAIAYITFLKKDRYKAALEQLKKGDVVRYCVALKNGGYFTADLTLYTKRVTAIYKEFLNKKDLLLSWQPLVIEEEKKEELTEEEPIKKELEILIPETLTPEEKEEVLPATVPEGAIVRVKAKWNVLKILNTFFSFASILLKLFQGKKNK